mgnify:FL=1
MNHYDQLRTIQHYQRTGLPIKAVVKNDKDTTDGSPNYEQWHRKQERLKLQTMLAEAVNTEPEICSHFGCGRTLTNQEKLFGNKCIHHSINKKQ